jgi:prepilin-type N-terminal cleavage/methylation domain-containing protein
MNDRFTAKGFSLVEVLLSIAVFSLLVTALAGAYLYGQESTVLAGNQSRATLLAEEGLEAVRNIRDAGFANLVDGTYGLATGGNQWNLSGSSDGTDIFTRSVTIATINATVKSVTSSVSWQQNAQRSAAVSAVSYLTDWMRLGITVGGVLAYGQTATSAWYRLHDAGANTFSAATAISGSGVGATFVVRTSPTKTEAVAGYVTTAGVLNVLCFDGSAWYPEWSTTVGGTATTRRFDIAYETGSGDAIVLYSANAAPTNELAYRTKNGSSGCGGANWSSATNLNSAQTTGVVQWVKLAWDKRAGQNIVSAVWADANADLSAMMWNGSTWSNEPSLTESSLERIVAVQDGESFDVEFESLSGDVMVVWGVSTGTNGTNGVRYRVCAGGTAACSWGAATTPPTFADDASTLDISANPNTDQMVFASVGNAGSDLQIGYWSGSAWTNTANADTSCRPPIAGARMVTTGWLVSGATARSIIVYNDQGAPSLDWFVGNAGVFTKQTDGALSPAPASVKNTVDMQMDPLSADRALLGIADSANDLFAKRVSMNSSGAFTWTNPDGAALETLLPQSINAPFGFAFWRQ